MRQVRITGKVRRPRWQSEPDLVLDPRDYDVVRAKRRRTGTWGGPSDAQLRGGSQSTGDQRGEGGVASGTRGWVESE